MNNSKRKIVFVGLSGGVDSAVSAALLRNRGYEVVGVFIKTWHPDFLECNEEEERLDAMRVAAHLNIPFLTFDFEDVYKKEVADYMISEYKIGRTPNPDVMCNKEIKFGAFLKKSLSMGADYVATGHYAIRKDSLKLLRGADHSKDQSYFLWTLNTGQLKKILFPIGQLKKTEVRKIAKKLNLPVADKKDSQGICFLGAIDLKEFLKHYIKPKKGKVLNEDGEIIGHHTGAVFHTLGERHGFTISKKSPVDGAYYIIGKDIKKNILIASQKKIAENLLYENIAQRDRREHSNSPAGEYARFQKEGFSVILLNTNWIHGVPDQSKTYTAQTRYHGELLSCKVKIIGKSKAKVTLSTPVLVASGQSCVLYDKDICLGGGVVKKNFGINY